ncbi:Golgi transport complex subunit 5-domain-containing protein [Panaeolus papilionaceus]|nr:Golgi transport complex subunit 5-domain-containing protein [Panaeolus papilionaceus]
MADYSVFATPDFDPNEYANAILAADSPDYKGSAKVSSALKSTGQESIPKEDISFAITKLSHNIEDVSKQIRNLITVHHEDLLTQASNASALSGTLTSVQAGLSDLDTSVEKLRAKVHVPYTTLQTLVARLERIHQASDLLRRSSRFVTLARRLQIQMNEMKGIESADSATDELATATVMHGKDIRDEKERAIAKAALSIAELGALLDGSDERDKDPESADATAMLLSVNIVAAQVPFIEEAKTTITAEMETMVLKGLSTLNQTLLASSLQTAFNLRILPNLVQNLLSDLSLAVEDRIRNALDINKISKEVTAREPAGSTPQNSQMYRSRVRTEPTNVTAPQFSAALWLRLEAMFQEMADCCIKVYALEKVLKMKKDTLSHTVFLDEAMKVLENTPTATFWTSLSRSLQKHFQDSSKASSFLQQTLVNGYPKLVRLFHEFFAKISVHTDTIYSDASQSPETILLFRSLSTLESQYLAKTSNKINDAVGQAFSASSRSPPGTNEGMNVARIIVNELDAARFDPLLVRAVAKSSAIALDGILSRLEPLIATDRTAYSLIGGSALPQQIGNASLANFMYQLWVRLSKLDEEHSMTVVGIIQPSVQHIFRVLESVMNPLSSAIRREIGAIILKLHRIDFSKPMDANAGMGGTSLYIKELTDKMAFIKNEIVGRYSLGDYGRNWVIAIVQHIIRSFVLHISIVCPLGESGKLQMASDMTGLEFALSSFLAESQNKRGGSLESIGKEYRALRAMRPLFFLEDKELASSSHTAGLPPLIVLHHILVRSPIPLPHKLHGWQEAEYVRWVDEHSEEEAWTLVEGGLTHWEKVSESEGRDTSDAQEYVELARKVLSRGRENFT